MYANPLTADLETYYLDEGDEKNHDCSDHSHCFNLLGTYTCSCTEGFSDESENPIYPGRTGCEQCNYHGTCIIKASQQVLCECFQ
jgi:Calcium-binding EGF domain